MKATQAAAILQVSDLGKALEYYTSSLGFVEDFQWGEPPFYAGVKMDDVVIHLCSSQDNAKRAGMGSVYVFCKDIDPYYEKIEANGVSITSKIATWPYGMRDFQVQDLDGNHIGFGAPVEPESSES